MLRKTEALHPLAASVEVCSARLAHADLAGSGPVASKLHATAGIRFSSSYLIAERFLENDNCRFACDDSHSDGCEQIINLNKDRVETPATATRVDMTMSDNKHNKDQFFSNEATVLRRAWIETAVNSVRARLNANPDADDLQPETPHQPRSLVVVQSANSAATPIMTARRRRPNLYVAWSVQERRSRA